MWGDSIGKAGSSLYLPSTASPEPSGRKSQAASPKRRDRGPKSRENSREKANVSAGEGPSSTTSFMMKMIPDEQGPRRGMAHNLRKAVDWGNAEYDASAQAVHTPGARAPPSILTGGSDLGFGRMTTNEEPSPVDSQASPGMSSPGMYNLDISTGQQWEMDGPKVATGEIAEEIDEQQNNNMGPGSGSMVQWRWKRGQLIGSGSYGRVYLGMNLDTGELLAVKQLEYMDAVESDREKVESLESEITIMRSLRHQNVCGYLGTERTEGDSPGTKILNILLEYVPGGSISQLLGSFGAFGEKVIQHYTRQILEGLHYLHQNKVAHRDVKGANILVTSDGRIKLSDFGHSRRLDTTTLHTHNFHSLKGTPFWMAPEVIKQEGHGRSADIWSVGCTIVEMATGKPPWSELSNQLTAMFTIATSSEPPAIPEGLSVVANDFISQCFTIAPTERPKAIHLLEHEFLGGGKPSKVPKPAFSVYKQAE